MPYWVSYTPDYPVSNRIPLALSRALIANVKPEMRAKPGLYFQTQGDVVTPLLYVRGRLQRHVVVNPQYTQTVVPEKRR